MQGGMTSESRLMYQRELEELVKYARSLPRTRMMAIGMTITFAILNMRWERVMVDRSHSEHPWETVTRFIQEARTMLDGWASLRFIEGEETNLLRLEEARMEERHKKLFQELWVNFSPRDYDDRIERYVHRLRINGLSGAFLEGRRCLDMGCGHGNFAHALVREGAASVVGIDYGEDSIRFAERARDELGVPASIIEFRVASVYDVPAEDASFDLVVQNGVFHHLDDEGTAYREAFRVLVPGGWMWIYTDGSGGVSHHLWDASVAALHDVPHAFILEVLDFLGVGTNKRYHLGDGLNATYRHTTLDELTGRLRSLGFGEFRRLIGGFATDFDLDVIEADPWGHEKFGEGDLRLLARKLVLPS